MSKNRHLNLDDIGFNSHIETFIEENGLNKSDIARVVAVYKDSYVVRAELAELKTTITGNFQHSAKDKSELPVIGDWVQLTVFDNHSALIIQVLPRYNFIERKAIGKSGGVQIIASNLDYGLIVDAVTENFNLNRIERYIAICNSAKVQPVVLLTKIDLINDDELQSLIDSIATRNQTVPILTISNMTLVGIDAFKTFLLPKKTYCLLGLSGVGKSTLINTLAEQKMMHTKAISLSTNKGVHTTSHRQLFLLNNGSIFIDNPGMREVALANSSTAIMETFDKISELAAECRFSDCTHSHEKDCAVLKAVENGLLDKKYIDNYNKMRKEQQHFQASKLERKKRDKDFGKMIKSVMKNKKSNKRKHD